jgi:hypothetical protein
LALSEKERKKQGEEEEKATHEEAVPKLSVIETAKGFQAFVTQIGPVVSVWDAIFGLMTIRDTRDTLTFLMVMTYALVYQETVVKLIPFFPLLGIVFVFYNYYYEVEFKRPRATVIRNMKLI